ncbi:MAG: hypothetical protein ACREIT_10075 [Tepidisphaeraceae bacterium]
MGKDKPLARETSDLRRYIRQTPPNLTGVKFFVNSTPFIFLMAEYQFFFEDSDDAGDAFDDGQFVYSLGIGLRF